DFTVERAVTAATRVASQRTASPADTLRRAADELQSRFVRQGWFRRWLSSVWQRAVADWLRAEAARQQPELPETDPLLAGLLMMRQRVSRLLAERGIERQEVEGRMFDAEWMHAVDAVDAPGTPSGHVVEQLRPAYFWKGRRIRDAEVRVAR
ncbi:MAG: nucleotide exchange factor GrpE, partial [Pirellulaceae bacterium]|nr:nucleotide exchange factor GrpE [Pirellulaceae bacterium]